MRFLVFLCILRFRFLANSCSRRFKVEVAGNYQISLDLGGLKAKCYAYTSCVFVSDLTMFEVSAGCGVLLLCISIYFAAFLPCMSMLFCSGLCCCCCVNMQTVQALRGAVQHKRTRCAPRSLVMLSIKILLRLPKLTTGRCMVADDCAQ